MISDMRRQRVRLEDEYGIQILSMREYGSYAKNMAGPNSDHDIQFVYVEHPVEYVTGNNRESIEIEYPEKNTEFSGWGLQKFVQLLHEDNPNAIEFLQSDLIHEEVWDLEPLAEDVFKTVNHAGVYHKYRSLAESMYHRYLSHHLVDSDDTVYPIREKTNQEYIVTDSSGGETRFDRGDEQVTETVYEPTVKRNLVVGRAALHAEYILAAGRLPPMDLEAFLNEDAPRFIDSQKVKAMRGLLGLKRVGMGDREIDDWGIDDGVDETWLPDREADIDSIKREGVPDAVTDAFTYSVYDWMNIDHAFEIPEEEVTYAPE